MSPGELEPLSRDWRLRSLSDLLEELGVAGRPEHDFPTDGWSGARFSFVERHGPDSRTERFVIKRTSLDVDWIAAATNDRLIREAWLANALGGPLVGGIPEGPTAYFGAAADGADAAIVMPDLTVELLAWERPGHAAVADIETVETVVRALARLHVLMWPRIVDAAQFRPASDGPFPWCPLPERLTLTARPTCLRHLERGIPSGVESAGKLLLGWDAFDRQAPSAARDLIAELSADPAPLVRALSRLPSTGLHGDLKLANVAVWPSGSQVRFIDWQMTIRAPVAVELGWFLVTNSAALPETQNRIIERYREAASSIGAFARHTEIRPELFVTEVTDTPFASSDDWPAQVDLAWIVGLLLRGWRKGMDAESGATLGSGVSGREDLDWWSEHAVAAAARRL
jgi:hypothetical protein